MIVFLIETFVSETTKMMQSCLEKNENYFASHVGVITGFSMLLE